jgi:hypothetical protein
MNEQQDLKPMTFVAACREFFGKLPHQTLQDFAAELKQLTPDDKAELVILFRNVGIDATKQS